MADTTNPDDIYVSDFSSRALPGQELDVLAPQKNPTLSQADVRFYLKASALPLPLAGARSIFDFDHAVSIAWDADRAGTPCHAVGAGVLQADVALTMTPAR